MHPPRGAYVSGESNSAYPLVLHTDADPSTLGGIAVCGFSTVGSVGVIAKITPHKITRSVSNGDRNAPQISRNSVDT